MSTQTFSVMSMVVFAHARLSRRPVQKGFFALGRGRMTKHEVRKINRLHPSRQPETWMRLLFSGTSPRSLSALLVLVCLLLAGPAWSVEGKIQLRGEHLFSSDVGPGQGEVQITRTRGDVGLSRYTLSWESSWFSWKNRAELPFGNGRDDPWDSLHMLALRVDHRDRLSERWSYFVQGALRSGFEKQVSRSLGAAVNGGLVYAWNESWTLGLGGFIGWDPTSEFAFSSTFAMIGPFVQYRHPRSPGFSARLAMPQSELRYTFDQAWSVWLGAGVNSGTYRLADASPVMPRGYLRERQYFTGLFLDYHPAPNLMLRLGPTYNFQQRMEIYDSSGDRQEKHHMDPALGLEAGLQWRF